MLVITGSGMRARSHLEALKIIRRFEEVRVWSARHVEDFARRYNVRATASAEEAVRETKLLKEVRDRRFLRDHVLATLGPVGLVRLASARPAEAQAVSVTATVDSITDSETSQTPHSPGA